MPAGPFARLVALGSGRLPEGKPAPESLLLREQKWDVDPAQLLIGFRNLLDVFARLTEQVLLETNQVRVDGAPMPHVVRVVAIPVLAFQQPIEIDQTSREIGRFHRGPS